ncbi:hypothetical protein AB1N83_011248 [Pleurotus pulmonarius]
MMPVGSRYMHVCWAYICASMRINAPRFAHRKILEFDGELNRHHLNVGACSCYAWSHKAQLATVTYLSKLRSWRQYTSPTQIAALLAIRPEENDIYNVCCPHQSLHVIYNETPNDPSHKHFQTLAINGQYVESPTQIFRHVDLFVLSIHSAHPMDSRVPV